MMHRKRNTAMAGENSHRGSDILAPCADHLPQDLLAVIESQELQYCAEHIPVFLIFTDYFAGVKLCVSRFCTVIQTFRWIFHTLRSRTGNWCIVVYTHKQKIVKRSNLSKETLITFLPFIYFYSMKMLCHGIISERGILILYNSTTFLCNQFLVQNFIFKYQRINTECIRVFKCNAAEQNTTQQLV